MSVCSGLDQIEDFLLSSTTSIQGPSNTNNFMGGPVINNSANNTRFMGPPFPTGNLNGLNLSLNHGLDLTSPTYGCLNLTQHNHSRQENCDNLANVSTGLNLTQNNAYNGNAPREDSNAKKGASEVGLNLSLHNGMDLTRQTYYYDGFDYNNQEQQQQFDTQQQRNSPLNLEHRSSPLNLTHNKYNQNQYFDFNNASYTNYTNHYGTTTYYYGNCQQYDYPPQPHHQPQHQSQQQSQQQPLQQQHLGQLQQQPQQPHQTTNNAKIRLFCSTCSQEFTSSNELNKHMEKHNMELNSACSTAWTNQNQQELQNIPNQHLNNNVKRTFGNNEFEINYDGNVMNYKVAETNQSVEIDPNSAMKFPTAEISLVNNSTNKKPGEEPQSSCSECSLQFPTGLDLKKHIDLAHKGRQGGKKYQCLQCAAEFDDIKSHKDHVESHALEKPFKCLKCGLHLTNSSGLKRHIRRVHDKSGPTFDCQECSKSFFEKFDLQRHMKVHSAPKCGKCGKTKSNKEKKGHVCKIPESEKDPDLKCTICGTFLDNKIKWGFHMWKHTKDPAYIQTKIEEKPLSLIKL